MPKFYRLQWYDAQEGRMFLWAETKKVANIIKMNVLKRYKDKPKDYESPVQIEEVDIPTDKVSLAKWLSRNYNKDNG
jgi:hypothetical protein